MMSFKVTEYKDKMRVKIIGNSFFLYISHFPLILIANDLQSEVDTLISRKDSTSDSDHVFNFLHTDFLEN